MSHLSSRVVHRSSALQLTFAWVVMCLCPIPINFTRRASNVKPAINWPLVISSAKSWFPIFSVGRLFKIRASLGTDVFFGTLIN